MIKFIKKVVEHVKLQQSMQFHFLNERLGTYNGIPLFIDDDVVYLATGCREEANAVADLQNRRVILNRAATKLDQKLLNALLLHEVGHIVLKHEIKNRVLYSIQSYFGFGSGLDIEYQADAYALSNGSDVLALLEFMKGDSINPALSKRIKRIKSLPF